MMMKRCCVAIVEACKPPLLEPAEIDSGFLFPFNSCVLTNVYNNRLFHERMTHLLYRTWITFFCGRNAYPIVLKGHEVL